MSVLDRVNARARRAQGERRSSIDQWISEYLLPAGMVNQFTFGSHVYGFGGAGGPQFSYGANKAREFTGDLPGHTAAVKGCPPAFAAEMVRAAVLSQARFTFRNPPWMTAGQGGRHPRATPRRTFGNAALSLLEHPWPNGTTGDLIARMEWHAGLAGNSFVTNWQQGNRLRVLRPDFTAIVYGSQQEPDDPAHALDGEILGYVYQNGGIYAGNKAPLQTLPVSSVAHWMPLPDPLNAGLGMSWVTPAVRAIQGDMLTDQHKIKFFENGAAQPYNARVLTPAGWTRMQDIAPGDLVTGPDGKARTVLGVYPQSEKDIYRLTFSGGAVVECCEDHLWTVTNAYDRKHGTSRTVTLRELLAAGLTYSSGAAKWSVPLTDPVEYAGSGPLPLDPYLLGMLLGDGSFRSNGKGGGGVTLAAHTPDADETAALIRPVLPDDVTLSRRDRTGKTGYRHTEFYFKGPGGSAKNPLTCIVRDLGLFDATSCDKAAPAIYMHAAVAARIALLQGLIDSDGHVNHAKHGSTGCTFTSTSEALSRQVRELVLSLGGTATCKRASDRPGEPGRKPQWRVYFNRLPEWIIPVRLSRKRAAYRPSGRGGRYQYLMSAMRDRREPARCIKVDAADGLYVTDDFVVTHNTPNLVIKGIPAATKEQFDGIIEMLEEGHAGVANAYRTLYLAAGADATALGADMQAADLRAVQGAGETRISVLSRVPAPLLGISEGLAGSSLNAGNFSAARRMFADSWIFPALQNLASTVAPLVQVPPDAELWYDTRDMPVLREDAKDAADIEQVKAVTINSYVKEGFTPESAVAAVSGQDITLLEHTGLLSVQLWIPGTQSPRKPDPAAESPSQPGGGVYNPAPDPAAAKDAAKAAAPAGNAPAASGKQG